MLLSAGYTEIVRFLVRIARVAEAQGLPQGIARDMAAIALEIPDQLLERGRVAAEGEASAVTDSVATEGAAI